MASIVGKRQGNKTYYYLVESARVGGKPRIVSQRYLGPAEEIVARLAETGPGEPDRTRHLAFGDIAAVWSVLERLKVAEIIDEVVGPRRADAGASVGTYISLAALNRACDPCSKLAFSDWWAKTAADRWVHLAAGALDHRRFWEAMDLLGEDQLAEAERRIVAHMVEAFGVELSGLVLDMTNFATWIASANDRAPIAQRGHSKQKRSDLRLVGLGLVVSTDGGIPLVSHAYPGNRPDVTQFPAMVGELARRFGAIPADVGKLTLVFDAGQNSDDNYELLDGLPFHFVGSLPPSDHPELLAVPKATYQPVEGFSGLSAFEAEKAVFGKARRIVVTHSEVLHEKQSAGFDQTLAKARGQLERGPGPSGPGQDEEGKTKRRGRGCQYLEAPLAVPGALCHPHRRGAPRASAALPHEPSRRARLEEELFGKRALFSDKGPELAPTAAIVAEYRSQESAEGDFRQMKDPNVVSFSPMYHWTDQKIRVHAFYCVLALMAARLMVREAERAGMHMSVRELLGTLAGIEETVLLYQGERGRPRARRVTTEMDATQQRLYQLFGLGAYAAGKL